LAHVGKLAKPDKCVAVGAVFNRDFRHLSRLQTAPTDAFHLCNRYEPHHFTNLCTQTDVFQGCHSSTYL